MQNAMMLVVVVMVFTSVCGCISLSAITRSVPFKQPLSLHITTNHPYMYIKRNDVGGGGGVSVCRCLSLPATTWSQCGTILLCAVPGRCLGVSAPGSPILAADAISTHYARHWTAAWPHRHQVLCLRWIVSARIWRRAQNSELPVSSS